MTDLLWQVAGFALAAFVIAAVLAPFETLGWWAGWFGPGGEDVASNAPLPAAPGPGYRAHVVLLMGINAVGDDLRPVHEERFIAELQAALGPEVRVVTNLFPYSAFGLPLVGDRALAKVWRRLAGLGDGGEDMKGGLLSLVINLRNVLQVGVSADRRYGPLYNYGAAQVIVDALVEQGFDPRCPTPVLLLGYSGGGQISLGAGGFVHLSLGCPVSIVSLGGVLNSEPGLEQTERLVHVAGGKDWLQRVGGAIFPQRWPVMRHSAWNRARNEGRLAFVEVPGVGHAGPRGYFGEAHRLPDGRTALETTVAIVAGEVGAAIARHEARQAASAAGPAPIGAAATPGAASGAAGLDRHSGIAPSVR